MLSQLMLKARNVVHGYNLAKYLLSLIAFFFINIINVEAAIYCPNHIDCVYQATRINCKVKGGNLWDPSNIHYNLVPDKSEVGQLGFLGAEINQNPSVAICLYTNKEMIKNDLGYVAVHSLSTISLIVDSFLPNKWIKDPVNGVYSCSRGQKTVSTSTEDCPYILRW